MNQDEIKALKIELLEIATQFNEQEQHDQALVKLIAVINRLDQKVQHEEAA